MNYLGTQLFRKIQKKILQCKLSAPFFSSISSSCLDFVKFCYPCEVRKICELKLKTEWHFYQLFIILRLIVLTVWSYPFWQYYLTAYRNLGWLRTTEVTSEVFFKLQYINGCFVFFQNFFRFCSASFRCFPWHQFWVYESFPIWRRTKNVRYFKCSNKTALFDLFIDIIVIFIFICSETRRAECNKKP